MDPVTEIPGVLALWRQAGGGDPAVRIAIIDGPIDIGHPALAGGRLSVGDDGAVTQSAVKSEHGTHVASVLMGTPGTAIVGVAPHCSAKVYSIYREGDDGELLPSSQPTLALTINRALADGADIINISSGQLTPSGEAHRILADAVQACDRAGKLIVAAAGNDGCRCLQVPAALDSVLAVGACDLDGRPLPFSNFGDAYLENGILAPGEDVKGASPSQGVVLRSGTSFATPIVTGVIALFLSLLRSNGRKPDPGVVRAALLASAVSCRADDGVSDLRCLNGVLNVSGAMTTLFPDRRASAVGTPQHEATEDRPALRPSDFDDVANASPIQALQATTGGQVMATNETSPHSLGSDGTGVGAPAGAPPVAPVAAAESAASAVAPSVMPATPGVMWVPVSMGSVMPSGFQQFVSALAAPGFQPAVMPAGAPPQAPVARTEASVGVTTPQATCGCGGVRPAQAQASQVNYLDPVLTSALQGPAGMSQMAFPLGQLYYDFGKEARVDYFVNAISAWRDTLGHRTQDPQFGPNRDKAGDTAAPYNPEIMARYLLDLAPGEQASPTPVDINFRDADALIWTLTIDTTPIYAVRPLDVFGLGFYSSLVQALWFQEVSIDPPSKVTSLVRPAQGPTQSTTDWPPKGRIARVSMAGWLDPAATTRLLNGTVVPTLVTDWRGFYQWDLYTLLGPNENEWPPGAKDFLDRIYNEFRNTGVSPQDRALNYSAMNALNTNQIFKAEAKKRRLDTVEVDKSTICRPDSLCYDVTYRFFDPMNVLTQARQVYQYTIDVSDVVPVPVGRVRSWAIY